MLKVTKCFAALTILVGLAACDDPVEGAVVGGLAGAAVGSQADDPAAGAVVGAAVGAVVGTAISR